MLCYSTGSLPDAFSFTQIADTLAASPFRGVELVVTPGWLERFADSAHWAGLRKDFSARGLAFRNVHLGMPLLLGPEAHRPGLASLDAGGRARRVEAAARAMEIALALGAPHMTLTTGLPEAGASAPGAPAGTQARQWEALLDSLGQLRRRKPREVDILIEQEPEMVVNAAAQLVELHREFGVLANFDVGHSEVMGEDIPASLRALGPLLRNLHLEDIAGRVHAHKLYGEGDVDFGGIFRCLREMDYRGDYTPDLYPFKDDYARALRASADFLHRHGALAGAL